MGLKVNDAELLSISSSTSEISTLEVQFMMGLTIRYCLVIAEQMKV